MAKVTQSFQYGAHTVVLETGEISVEGPADTLMHDDAIRKAYLGV